MALSLQLGFPDVPKSITNPNVDIKNVLDRGSPFSFLSFLKLIEISFEPDTLQEYYKYYLKVWNSQNISKPENDGQTIIERYRELIKELTLHYTTLEEKRFLSKIDFNDPYDLDVAMGFYAKKLKQLTDFYNKKRNDIKFNITRTKIKGTNYGTEKTITELTLNYLKSLDDNKILYDFDAIQSRLEVEVEELYDAYSLYFNQIPDSIVYDKKDLDYGLGVFLKTNTELLSTTFSNISDELKSLKELDSLLDNKRKLTEKDIFTDFYYLSTGDTVTDFISGRLFTSPKLMSSFPNREYPTTASTEHSDYLRTPRETGFFRPMNSAIVLVDGITTGFTINFENLSPKSLYYFPDPSVFGEGDKVLSFVVDSSYLKRNITSGNAVNQPQSNPQDTKYYGYVSRIDPNVQKNLDAVFDYGFIKDSKRDIYGNTFALFDNSGDFKSTLTVIPEEPVRSMLVDGYKFYDDMYNEGLNFDYTVTDYLSTFSQTVRTGLSSNTGNFTEFNPDVIFFFGRFQPYLPLATPTQKELVPRLAILETAYITNWDSTPYIDTYSSDLSAFDTTTGQYYYNSLIECGTATANPYQRALLDPSFPSLTANLTEYIRSSALKIFDGGEIMGKYEFDIVPVDPFYELLSSSFNNTEFYTLSNLPSGFDGKILVKNASTKTVQPLFNALPYFVQNYSAPVLNDLDGGVTRFDLDKDVIFIETPNYLVVNKVKYEDGQFVSPNVRGLDFQHNTNWCDKFTNRVKVKDYIYYCQLMTTTPQLTSTGNITIYPKIYRLDTLNFTNTLLYNVEDASFEINGENQIYSGISTPTLAYNSRNNIFKISFLLKNINNAPSLFEYDFKLSPNVEFMRRTDYLFNSNAKTIEYDTIPSTYNFFLSSNHPMTQSFELIL